tara:strand:- start:614 stop:919 length:306 start_codon:yes stop_codon:yes gene_type:complete
MIGHVLCVLIVEVIEMSWKEEIKKEESAKDFVLNSVKTGKSMADSLREFAKLFPDRTPPNHEDAVKRAEELDEALARLDESREKMENFATSSEHWSRQNKA